MNRRIVKTAVLLVVLGLATGASPVWAQGDGTISGQVVFKETGEAIYSAEVLIEGTAISTTTDRTGRYRLAGVPAGTHTLLIKTEGFSHVAKEVTVAAGEEVTFDAALEIEFAGVVDVDAPYLRGQARALTQQKNAANIVNVVAADQIGSFPDPNIADAGGRIAGISLIRDDGEGEQMTVRGMQPTLNSVTMNGERIPSTGNTDRSIDFIFMSSDILQSIEVAKALTPDMDGDAIGGSINLVTKQAPEEQVLNVDLQSGYNDLLDEINYLGGFTYGKRFSEGRSGLVLSGSYRNEDRGNETLGDVVWEDTDITELILRGEMGHDERYSLNAAYDWLFNDGSMFTLRGTWTERDQNKIRRRSRLQNIPDGIGDDGGRIRKEVRNRDRTTGMYSLSAGGTTLLTSDWQIDYQLAYNASYRDEPNTYSWRFQQSDVEFTIPEVNGYDVHISPVNENDAESSFRYVQELPLFSDDTDLVGRVDVTYALTGTMYGYFKFGGKYRMKEKTNDEAVIEWTEGDTEVPSWADVSESEVYHIYDDDYGVLGQYPGVNWGRDAIELYGLVPETDLAAELNDYTADEDVAAAYAQVELNTSPKLMLLFGVRYEYTSSSYDAFNLVDGEELVPVSGDDSYGSVLPGFHARYAINDRSNLRFAATTAMSRPNFIDIVPRQDTNTEDEEIDRGNPGLDPSTAVNLDLLYEYYFEGVGVLTAGVFYKDISDPIVSVTELIDIDGTLWDVTQPDNGKSAELIGFEAAFQNRWSNGIGVMVNYTYTDSELELPNGRMTPFIYQPEHTGNLSLSYERGGFAGRVAFNLVSSYLDPEESGGETALTDLYGDYHRQWDLVLNQRLNKHLQLYLNVLNLNNAQWNRYYGGEDEIGRFRANWQEQYSWWAQFGVRYSLW